MKRKCKLKNKKKIEKELLKNVMQTKEDWLATQLNMLIHINYSKHKL